jgi:hypothetical protein
MNAKNKHYKKERIESKLKSYLAEARSEYDAYKGNKSRNTTQLAEAGEKLWGAFNYYMELRAGVSLKTAAEVRSAVYAQEDTNLINLYDKASFLHQFFYGWDLISLYDKASFLHQFFYGWADRKEDVESSFKEVANGLEVYMNKDFLYSSKKSKKLVKV